MPHLFESIKIGDVTFRNRVGVSPMCQYCYQDGLPLPGHLIEGVHPEVVEGQHHHRQHR